MNTNICMNTFIYTYIFADLAGVWAFQFDSDRFRKRSETDRERSDAENEANRTRSEAKHERRPSRKARRRAAKRVTKSASPTGAGPGFSGTWGS